MHKRGRLWHITFIAGTIYYTLITLVMLVASGWIAYESNLPYFLPLIVSIIVLVSIILAVKWTIVSGGMLVIASLFLIVWGIFLAEDPNLVSSIIFFLPSLIVGTLFIFSWFHSRYQVKDANQ